MKKLVKCKVCGFIMEEKSLKGVCPACGVPKTAFVEYKYSISEKRQEVLNLHIHPITVHFPEAIAVFNLAFMILAFTLTGTISNNLIITVKTLSIIFPLTILVAIFSGIYDAKIRFKKLSPPYLKIKIYLGVVLLIFSILTIILLQGNLSNLAEKSIIIIILSLINLITSIILGKMGGKLIDSRMPG